MKVEPFGPLEPALYREIVRRALAEDLRWGDITTEAIVPGDRLAKGLVVVKAQCVLAGLDVAAEAFRQLDPHATIERYRRDGEGCEPGEQVAAVSGFAAALLTAERTALNFLQRLSGIATLTRRFVEASTGAVTVLDTRKTTPTLRMLEKYAVRAGGGVNHRVALDDGILIKDSHARLAGGITEAVERIRAADYDLSIEVETQSLAEVDAALVAGASVVMVDNMTIEDIREAVRRSRGRARIEISGGVTLDRMPDLARTGAEYVSVGALTHSAPAADISFEIDLSDTED